MFSAGSGAYRRTKIVIDWINIFLGVAVVIMAIAIFAVPGNYDFLLPVVFFMGTVMQGLHAAKNYFKFETKKGNILILCTMAMLFITVCSVIVMW